MTIAAGLIVSRWLHYLAVSILFGALLFPFYARRDSASWSADMSRALHRLCRCAAITACFSAVLWFLFTTAGMGGTLAAAFNSATLSMVAGQTDFGRLWMIRLALALAIAVRLSSRSTPPRMPVTLLAAGLLLISLAGTGHAAADSDAYWGLHVVADIVHLLMAAIWIGALCGLATLLREAARSLSSADIAAACTASEAFSKIGLGIVGLLLLSGLVNAWFLIGRENLFAFFGDRYRQVLFAKLVLFAGMLVLAAANRFWLTPRLGHVHSQDGEERNIRALRASVFGEAVLAVLVLAAVAILGTLPPPRL